MTKEQEKAVQAAKNANTQIFAKLRRLRESNPTKEDIQEHIDLEQRQKDSVKDGYLCPYSTDGTQPSYCTVSSCKYVRVCKTYLKTYYQKYGNNNKNG